MTFNPDRVSTVTFDSYGTLVDVTAVERTLADHVDNPEPISDLWRARSLQYAFVANGIDAYRPFYALLGDALDAALAAHGVDLPEDERDAILETYHDLDVFADVRDGIERLHERGYPCYIASNGNPEMLDSLVEGADLGGVIEDTISAEEVETFKPVPEIYRHAAARTGTPIEEIAHVCAGWFDVLGATHAGMQAVWVNRDDAAWEPFGGDPALEIGSFHDLADELGV